MLANLNYMTQQLSFQAALKNNERDYEKRPNNYKRNPLAA